MGGGRCADISNVLKAFSVARHWAVRVTNEFFAQATEHLFTKIII